MKSKKGIDMMENIVEINGVNLQIKMWNGQRVITLSDIDTVHGRPEGTAKKNFQNNRKHFVENEDYFEITRQELREKFSPNSEPLKGNPKIKTYLFTESGYLMVAKSFTDDLAWKVQRQLVNSYFKFKEVMENLQPVDTGLLLSETKFVDALDTITTCAAIFQSMIDYSTINYKQQQDLLQTARKRVNSLLGGAHSPEYKEYSRIYFKNLWQDFCKAFQCGSYKDLNPLYVADDVAKKWIQNWRYTEN